MSKHIFNTVHHEHIFSLKQKLKVLRQKFDIIGRSYLIKLQVDSFFSSLLIFKVKMKLFFALIQFGYGFALPPYSALSKLITNFQTLVKIC